ncbi:MAG: serine O-acetyltransferase [Planctomycetota bacterium]|nr:serine O-acetyltransferase [Planctomycetota bacterium]
MKHSELQKRLPGVADHLVESILAEPRMQHLNQVYLPSRDAIVEGIFRLRQLVFPGYFGKQGLTRENVTYRTGELVTELSDMLFDQVRLCLRYAAQLPGANGQTEESQECESRAGDIVAAFFDRIPGIRRILATDVQAAFDGDPAAQSADETIFCYPGLYAITVQRLAHVFYEQQVPLLPRIMTEYAHSETGVDIHPGAELGERFFIDHGTGVVIGETAQIGNNVKIYQGVTLGALAPAFGQLLRGHKRHPTIEDDVTLYSGSTILGGDTVIGRGVVINGNVFITSSVPPYTVVSMEPPKLTYRPRRGKPSDDSAGREAPVG